MGKVGSAAAAGRGRSSGARRAAHVVSGRGLHHTSPAAAAGAAPSLCLTALRPHLRVLHLFNTTSLTSLAGIGGLVVLEKGVLTRCSRLYSLSPLGMAPSLRDIAASQSGVFELTGLALSRTLVSLCLYGCLNLTDVSVCGGIPTLRDMLISESTVEVLDGLRESRSRSRLGMRYFDVPLLAALSPVPSLTILHASSFTRTSVAALQHCTALEAVEVSACAQLFDLRPLGLAPSSREIVATGSSVRRISGVSRSCSLERLLLGQCLRLHDIGPLGECASPRELHLSGAPVQLLQVLANPPVSRSC
ncbi:hypothetical protein LSCM1_01577 [Leishmania martiniquensis]|uniref:Leucine-rich repeat protein n=1 Tax=Leishmania martiniquensis TaxID=1580590 RepID=A0A836KI21_9TRYP|nr:hypothetical protein LSCM1_01577 [Leishmania martiniquensis]